MLVFSTQLDLYSRVLALSPSLWFNSPPSVPPSCVNKYTVYKYTVCKGGYYGVLGLRQMNTCRKVALQVNYSR